MNPELGTQDVPGLDLGAETEEAAGGELVLSDGICCMGVVDAAVKTS